MARSNVLHVHLSAVACAADPRKRFPFAADVIDGARITLALILHAYWPGQIGRASSTPIGAVRWASGQHEAVVVVVVVGALIVFAR